MSTRVGGRDLEKALCALGERKSGTVRLLMLELETADPFAHLGEQKSDAWT